MATKTHRTFTTRIDIPESSREQLVELLNARLADTFDLYSQVKQAHWNVKGSDFVQLHELYDLVAADVIEYVDTVAERATALGGLALGTARMAAKASTLDEYPLDAVDGMDTVAAVADRLAAYGALVREGIDAGDRARGHGHGRPVHRHLTGDRQAPLVRRGAPAVLTHLRPAGAPAPRGPPGRPCRCRAPRRSPSARRRTPRQRTTVPGARL